MEWFVRGFLRSALAWLGLGVSLGVGMAVYAPWIVYRPAHMHMNLLGFVAMMIFGVAYHVVPRFTGRPLHAPRLAEWHFALANTGLAFMALGFILRPHGAPGWSLTLGVGAALSAAGAYCFVYNLWRTIGPAPRPIPSRPRPLPTV